MRIKARRTNYFPNSLGGGCPVLAPQEMGGYVHHAEKVEGRKVRERSESFKDFYSQATMFWNSQSPPEKEHIVQALQFELGMVESKEVRQRMLGRLAYVDAQLAAWVAQGIGVEVPPIEEVTKSSDAGRIAPELSMANTVKDTIKSRRVAIVAADGFNEADVTGVAQALTDAGAQDFLVSKYLGTITGANGTELAVDKTFRTGPSVTFDAVFIPGGAESIATLQMTGYATHFVGEAFKHCKAIAATGESLDLLASAGVNIVGLGGPNASPNDLAAQGIVTAQNGADLVAFAQQFITAIAQHRFWHRAQQDLVPA